MPAPKPDTSPANVAALLRRGAIWLQTPAKAEMTLEADMLALADALDQREGPTDALDYGPPTASYFQRPTDD